MQELKIDPELQSKIPPLTDAEFEQLRENILSAGEVRDPIVVWNGVIVDGHNRWKIVQEHPGIKFETRPMDFPDKWAAFDWMYKNQLGRRNLTDEQRTLLLGKMYEARKNSVGGDRGNQYTKMASHQNDDMAKPKKHPARTAESIAKEMGIGQSTVERAGQFAKGYDVLSEISPEAAQKLLEGKTGVRKSTIRNLPIMQQEQQRAVAEAIINNKPVQKQPPKEKQKEPELTPRQTALRQSALVDAIAERTSNTESPSAYNSDMIVKEIRTNGAEFVGSLKRYLTEYSTYLSEDGARPRIRDALTEIISGIEKVRNLL